MHRDFDQRLLDFPEPGKYIPLPGTLNKLLIALVCSEIDTVIFLSFELVGRNRAPLHFKTEGVADTALSAP